MIRSEMARVLAFIQLGDNRHVDGLVLDYWMEVVGDLPFEDAMQAVRRFRRERPGVYLEPGHLLELAGVVDEKPSPIPDLTEQVGRALALERAGLTEEQAAAMTVEELAARLQPPRALDAGEEWAVPVEVDDE